MATTDERFADIDAYLAEVEERLRLIARRNAALSEMVEVLGGYGNAALGAPPAHQSDPDAHER